MSKVIKYGDEAEQAVLKGIDTVADIVKTTVGPKGRNVLVREQISPPIITNDGATIAKSIELKDNVEDAAAQLIIQAANKTNEVAGDGTTTTTILAQEMIHKYYEQYKDSDVNVVQIQKDMVKTADEISDYLKTISTPVKSNEDIERVANISSGDTKTGNLIAKAFEMSGDYGSVVVEESKTGLDNLTTIEGMKLTNGMVNQFLISDRVKRKTDMVDVSLLITTDKLDSVPDLFKVYDYIIQNNKKLLIVCDDIEIEPLNMTIYNKAQGKLPNVAIIRLPGFGELREKLLEDICIATGATLMGREQGISLRDFDGSTLGELAQVTVTMDDSIIKFKDVTSDGKDLATSRKERVNELKETMRELTESQKEEYKRRISNLISGVSIIEVGGNSQVEMEDKKLRIEDAINSVQSAKEEGIVPGGGFSFLKAYIDKCKENSEGTPGQEIVYESLKAVTRQIAENAGFDGSVTISDCFNKELGFNALTGEYENLIETGVINSVKVDRYSLINATSVASTVITMGGVICEENEKDQNVLQLQTTGPMPMM